MVPGYLAELCKHRWSPTPAICWPRPARRSFFESDCRYIRRTRVLLCPTCDTDSVRGSFTVNALYKLLTYSLITSARTSPLCFKQPIRSLQETFPSRTIQTATMLLKARLSIVRQSTTLICFTGGGGDYPGCCCCRVAHCIACVTACDWQRR